MHSPAFLTQNAHADWHGDYRTEVSMICSQQHRASRCGEFPQPMLRRVRPTAGSQQRRKMMTKEPTANTREENGTSEEWLWSSPRASRIRRGSITVNKKPPFFNGGFIGGRYFQIPS
jgi:hypothetical protein